MVLINADDGNASSALPPVRCIPRLAVMRDSIHASTSLSTADGEIIIKKIKKGGHGGHHGGAWKWS
jgi:hypothetical protein